MAAKKKQTTTDLTTVPPAISQQPVVRKRFTKKAVMVGLGGLGVLLGLGGFLI